MTVRPLFGGFMPAADIPVPQFLTRQLLGSSRQLASYYVSPVLWEIELAKRQWARIAADAC